MRVETKGGWPTESHQLIATQSKSTELRLGAVSLVIFTGAGFEFFVLEHETPRLTHEKIPSQLPLNRPSDQLSPRTPPAMFYPE